MYISSPPPSLLWGEPLAEVETNFYLMGYVREYVTIRLTYRPLSFVSWIRNNNNLIPAELI